MPVTFGGGKMIEKFFDLLDLVIGSKSLLLFQNLYHLDSTKS
jgi:hypothetical protein